MLSVTWHQKIQTNFPGRAKPQTKKATTAQEHKPDPAITIIYVPCVFLKHYITKNLSDDDARSGGFRGSRALE
jgi:hypothetical protein